MKLSRDWLNDYVDLRDISDGELEQRFTEIGHAVESVEKHGSDSVFDLEITTNRVDAMSHVGMARYVEVPGGDHLLSVKGKLAEDAVPTMMKWMREQLAR